MTWKQLLCTTDSSPWPPFSETCKIAVRGIHYAPRIYWIPWDWWSSWEKNSVWYLCITTVSYACTMITRIALLAWWWRPSGRNHRCCLWSVVGWGTWWFWRQGYNSRWVTDQNSREASGWWSAASRVLLCSSIAAYIDKGDGGYGDDATTFPQLCKKSWKAIAFCSQFW